eukprot:2495064-Amphidinium_carterae.1
MAAHAWASAAIVCVAPCGIHPGAADRGPARTYIIAWLWMQDKGSAEPLAKHIKLGWAIWERCAHGEIEKR